MDLFIDSVQEYSVLISALSAVAALSSAIASALIFFTQRLNNRLSIQPEIDLCFSETHDVWIERNTENSFSLGVTVLNSGKGAARNIRLAFADGPKWGISGEVRMGQLSSNEKAQHRFLHISDEVFPFPGVQADMTLKAYWEDILGYPYTCEWMFILFGPQNVSCAPEKHVTSIDDLTLHLVYRETTQRKSKRHQASRIPWKMSRRNKVTHHIRKLYRKTKRTVKKE